MAEKRSPRKGNILSAGIGWYQLDDNRGFFVEHHHEEVQSDDVISENEVEEDIKTRIYNSLKDMCKFRDIKFDKNKLFSSVTTAKVGNMPTSALSIAVYKSHGWKPSCDCTK
jgi:pyruvoyl-dependent arginine decarboxylase (PvlArgDC)